MFKLVIVSVLVAVVAAKPGSVIKPEAQGAQAGVAAQPDPAPGPQAAKDGASLLSGVSSDAGFGLEAASAEAAKPVEALRTGAAEGIPAPGAQSVAGESLIPAEGVGAIGAGEASAAAPRPARAALIAAAPYLALTHPQPLVYSSYAAPAAAIGEKTITSYGHSIYHGGAAYAQPAYFAPTYAFI